MLGKDALQQREGVLKADLVGRLDQGAGVSAPSSGAWELSSLFLCLGGLAQVCMA